MDRRLLAVGSLLILAACQSDRIVSPPQADSPVGPVFSISSGNPNFGWRPPIANQSATGTFNASFSPKVRICSPAPVLASTNCADGSPEYSAPVTGDKYQYGWKTPKTPTTTYRVEVWNLGTRLGYVDVNTGKSAMAGFLSVNAGANLPIKFVITTDCTVADCVDPNIGGTVTTELDNGKIAGVEVPPQGGGNPITINIHQCSPNDLSVNGLKVHGSCITIDAEGLGEEDQLTNDAIVFICDIFQNLPDDDDNVEIHRRHNNQISVLQGVETNACNTTSGANPTVGSIIRALAHGEFKKAARRLLGMMGPKPLYALHLGAGGKTGGFSDFQFAEMGGFDFGADGYSFLNDVVGDGHSTAASGSTTAPSNWADFGDPPAGWPIGRAAFGEGNVCSVSSSDATTLASFVNTSWPLDRDVLIRKNFSTTAGSITITVYADNDVQIWLDGVNITSQAVETASGAGYPVAGTGHVDGAWFVHGGCANGGYPVITVPVSNGLHTLAVRGDDYGGQSHLDAKVVFTPTVTEP